MDNQNVQAVHKNGIGIGTLVNGCGSDSGINLVIKIERDEDKDHISTHGQQSFHRNSEHVPVPDVPTASDKSCLQGISTLVPPKEECEGEYRLNGVSTSLSPETQQQDRYNSETSLDTRHGAGSSTSSPGTFSDTLIKQLQAQILDAVWHKDKALSENQKLQEKVKALEKTVKQLTKKLKSLEQAVVQLPPKTCLSIRERENPRTHMVKTSPQREKSKRRSNNVKTPLAPIQDDVSTQRHGSSPPPMEGSCHDKGDGTDKMEEVEVTLDHNMELKEEDDDYKPNQETPIDGDIRVHFSVGGDGGGKTERKKRKILPKGENGEKICPKCPICSKDCRSYSELEQHMAVHTGDKRYKCTFCDKAFIRKFELDNHFRSHSGEKPYTCHVCGKGFAVNSVYWVHMKTHTGERCFQCSICAKTFLQSAHLAQHMRIHTGQRPFECSFCSRTFNQKANLVHHERIHTGERPFQCFSCGRMFISSSQLNRHRRSHSEEPYQCVICFKAFSENLLLTRHMTIHTGEKPHVCSICKRAFRLKHNLTQHTRTHNNNNNDKVKQVKQLVVS